MANFMLEKLGNPTDSSPDKLVIVSRTMDPYSIFAHSHLYGSAASDYVLDETLTFVDNDSGKNNVYKVSDTDQFWKKHNGNHISSAVDALKIEIKEQSKNNVGSNITSKTSIKEATELFIKSQVAGNKNNSLNMNFSLISKITKKTDFLNKVLVQEQKIMCSNLQDNSAIENVYADILRLLSDSKVSDIDRARLIGLYSMQQQGIEEDKFDHMCKIAKLSNSSVHSLKNLSKFGLPIYTNKKSEPRHQAYLRPNIKYEDTKYLPTISKIIHSLDKEKTIKEIDFLAVEKSKKSYRYSRNTE
ncbi:MAG: hypothetical protein MHPSP_002504 [Paramarteilia canceri]